MVRLATRSLLEALRKLLTSRAAAHRYMRVVAPLIVIVGWSGLTLVLLVMLIPIVSALSGTDSDQLMDRWVGAQVWPMLVLLSPALIYIIRGRIRRAADETPSIALPRPARKRWRRLGREAGVFYAGYAWCAVAGAFGYVTVVAATGARLLGVEQPSTLFTFEIPFWTISPPLSILAYFFGRNEYTTRLQVATPPELHRTHQLRDHADALENAMHEATLMAEELQRIIESEQRLVGELLEESAEAQRITAISTEQVNAFMARFDREQRRTTHRERWVNVVIALVSLAVGYALNLVDAEFLTNLIRG